MVVEELLRSFVTGSGTQTDVSGLAGTVVFGAVGTRLSAAEESHVLH